jgi:hypothetical protein
MKGVPVRRGYLCPSNGCATQIADTLAAARWNGKWIEAMPVLGHDVAPEEGCLAVETGRPGAAHAISGRLATIASLLSRMTARSRNRSITICHMFGLASSAISQLFPEATLRLMSVETQKV